MGYRLLSTNKCERRRSLRVDTLYYWPPSRSALRRASEKSYFLFCAPSAKTAPHDGIYFYSMDLIDGGSLASFIRDRALADRKSIEILEKTLLEVVELDPSLEAASIALAEISISIGGQERCQNALNLLQMLFKANPNHLRAHQLAAAANAVLGRWTQTLEHLTHWLELDPDNSTPLLDRVYVLVALGLESSALREIQTAIDRNPKDATLYLARAL